MNTAKKFYLLIGSNLGNRKHNIDRAIDLIKQCVKCKHLDCSPYFETEPWGYKDQPWFLNVAVSFRSSLPPYTLLLILKAIEMDVGRTPTQKWQARIIDIDILFAGNTVLSTPKLTVPHKHIAERKFALMCMNALSPNFVHPTLRKRISTLLNECHDPSVVNNYSKQK